VELRRQSECCTSTSDVSEFGISPDRLSPTSIDQQRRFNLIVLRVVFNLDGWHDGRKWFESKAWERLYSIFVSGFSHLGRVDVFVTTKVSMFKLTASSTAVGVW
jgi:hypothetical protein